MQDLYSLKIGKTWQAFKEESWAFWLICLYLFLEYVRPQSIYTSIDILPWPTVAIVGAALAYFGGKEKEPVPSPLHRLLIIYLIIVLISSALAFQPGLSFSKLRAFTDWLVIYYLIIKIVNTEKKYFLFLLLYFFCNFKMTQHGFLSWARRGFAFEGWGVTGGPGWFQNSGEFGIQLCIFVPMVSYFIVALKKHWGKFTYGFMMLMPITGLASAVASSSRGALVGLAAVALMGLFKTKYFFRTVITISILSVIVYHIIPEESMDRFRSSGEDKTSNQRLERWTDGIEMMNDHPLFGIGFENWMAYQLTYYQPEGGYGLSHNIFIQAGSELGYSGLIVFILMILCCFMINRRSRKLAPQNDFIVSSSHGLDAGLVGFLISGFFVTVLYYPYFWIHSAFIVALHHVASKQASATAEPANKRNKKFYTPGPRV